MQQRIMNILQQLRDRWTALGRGKQIRLVSVVLVLLLAIAGTVFFLTRPQLVVIRTDMAPEELAQARTVLQDNGINAQVTNNTTALSVPKQSVDNARLLLATSGISSPEITYSDALNLGIGAPESTRSLVEKKAKETDIENSLRKLRNINDAQVMLNIPGDTPFVLRSQDLPSASVVLDTAGELSSGEAEAIAAHIAKSVANLKIENVSLVDTNGRSLYQPGPDGISGSMSRQQEIEAAKKSEIENQVRQFLMPRFDMVDAMATLVWDWTGSSVRSTTYTPYNPEASSGLPSSESLSESTYENVEPGAEPGVQSNNGQTATQYPTGTEAQSSAETSQSDRSFLYNTEELETSLPATGRWIPENSSFAVTVYVNRVFKEDDLRANGALDNTTWDDFKTNTLLAPVAIDLSSDPILDVIRNATGVQNVVIYGQERPVFVDTVATTRPINQMLMAALLLLIIGLLAFGLIRRTQPVEIEEIEPELLVEDMLVSSEAQQTSAEESLPEIDYFAESELKKQIDKFVDDKPEAAAQLLRNWLSEEWE